MKKAILWNDKVKLIISDVDETIADLYLKASPEMVRELEKVLEKGKVLFLISGQGIQGIMDRIVSHIRKNLRRQVIIGHCSGTEVFGFDKEGNLIEKPFYSIYEDAFSNQEKKNFREAIRKLITEFKLKAYETMPVEEFRQKSGGNPLSIMLEDRGPQITFEMPNSYDLSPEEAKRFKIPNAQCDLRIPILERAERLFRESSLQITPRIGGVFALDFTVKGASKATAVRYVIQHDSILSSLGLSSEEIENPRSMEVWGDKFSATRGGTDRHISEALPKEVRSIDFREEKPEEFPMGYNIVVWNGRKHLHEGLLEYLRAR